ncbi:Uncharacterised protein [Klebsiella pneumoniae]|nr:Uncharacterised protein [Klebsiella pneumoniae]
MMPLVNRCKLMTMFYKSRMSITVSCVQNRYLTQVKRHLKPCKIEEWVMLNFVQ